MGELTIVTNGAPRDPLRWHELSARERAEFDYLDTDDKREEAEFVRYRGAVYHLGDFCRIGGGGFGTVVPAASPLAKWDGYSGDSYFSGVVVRYVEHGERVIVGRYYS